MRHEVYTLSLIRRLRAFGQLPRRRRMPHQLQPDSIRLEYFKAILPVVRAAHGEFRDVRGRILALREYESAKERRDAPAVAEAYALVDEAHARFSSAYDPHELRAVAARFGQRVSGHQREQLDRQLRAAMGVSVHLLEQPVLALIPAFTSENAELVKSVGDRYFERLRKEVTEAFSAGMHPDTLAERFVEVDGMAENDARRLARDQIGKLNGQVNQVRQEALGVEEFDWQTMNDGKVRDSHAALQGERFRWDDPPIDEDTGEVITPGSAVQCRCYGAPVLDALLG